MIVGLNVLFQICSLEDVEKIMDDTRDAVEYQQVIVVTSC